MLNLGDFAAGATVYIPFETMVNGLPVTMTGLLVSDIEVYKDGGTTQRASDSGYALLDTDGIDFDGVTGFHGISIDLSDNTDAGFFAAGSDYWVLLNTITVSGNAVTPLVAIFSVDNRSTAAIKTDTAAILVDTVEIGLAGAGLTNINLPNQTMDIIGDITGNVSGSVGSVTGAVGSVTGAVGSVTGAVGSVTGHTAQTGDTYALANGAAGFVAIDTVVDSILVDTAVIGAAGAGLTDLGGMSTGMKAEINIEADTALTDYDPPTNAEMIARTLAQASYFDPAADTVANVTLVATTTTNTDMRGTDSAATATSLATAQLDLDTITGTDGVTLATAQALYAPNVVVPPSVAQFDARTLVAASYFDPAADTVATVTTLTGHTAQTGDTYALANGAAGFVAIDTVVDGIQTDLSNATDGLGAIKADTAAVLTDTADMQPKLGTPAADLAADVAAVKVDTAAILIDTAAFDTALADSIPADGTIPSPKQALYMLTQFMLERAVSSTTCTVKKADGTTALFTLTLDSATAPTSITRAT